MSSEDSDVYHAGAYPLPKKKLRRSVRRSSTDYEDSSHITSHLCVPWQLEASEPLNTHIGHWLGQYTSPGLNRPFMRNNEEGRTDKLIEYDKNEDVFGDMLDFLFSGDMEKINKSQNSVEKLEQEASWILQILDMIDSDPQPKSSRRLWENHLLEKISEQCNLGGEIHSNLERMIDSLGTLSELQDKKYPANYTDSNEIHRSWNTFLNCLVAILCPVFTKVLRMHFRDDFMAVTAERNGEWKDTIPIYRTYQKEDVARVGGCEGSRGSSGGTIRVTQDQLLSAYNVNVSIDLLLQNVFRGNQARTSQLKTLTFQIGSQNINLDMVFQTDQSVYGRPCEDNNEDKMGISSEDLRISGGEYSGMQDTEQHFGCSGIATKIKSQHLLELASTARSNRRPIRLNRLRLPSNDILSTAGILFFNNAIILSKLDVDFGKFGYYDECDYENPGRYIICDKCVNPWKGHWKDIARYIFVCCLTYHILDDPVQAYTL